MTNYLLFQAYGNVANINECKYFLLRYWNVYKMDSSANISIIIYTDQPQLFQEYTSFSHLIEIKKITLEQVKEWRGEDNFVHRVKIKIIQDFFLSHKGNLLYCDTDTYITKPLQEIFNNIEQGHFYMHEFEGILGKRSNIIFRKWDKFLSETTIEYNGKKLVYSKNIEMWNAGVIGFNSDHSFILDDVLSLTDILYKKYPKHIAEQFAFDYCLQNAGKISSATNSIIHYWDLKELRSLLNNFFNANTNTPIDKVIPKACNIDPVKIQEEKEAYKNLAWFTKLFNKITGRKWTIEKHLHLI